MKVFTYVTSLASDAKQRVEAPVELGCRVDKLTGSRPGEHLEPMFPEPAYGTQIGASSDHDVWRAQYANKPCTEFACRRQDNSEQPDAEPTSHTTYDDDC